VSAGVWIAPGQLAAETRDMLETYGLSPYVSLFRAEYLAFGDVRDQVGRWWDLSRLEQLYQAFIDSAGPVLDRWDGGPVPDVAPDDAAAAAFADYMRVLTAWRRLPFLDPGLPAGLLPADWHGTRAAELFDALRARLAGPAHAHVLALKLRG
jgi:phenylacetic acid degradation operon negative regulatory protein